MPKGFGTTIVITLAVLAALILWGAWDMNQNPELTRQQAAQARIHAAEAAIRSVLREPGSAEFRGEFLSSRDSTAICGEVNARNGFGGMTGFQPFVVADNGAIAAIEPPEGMSDPFWSTWSGRCMPA